MPSFFVAKQGSSPWAAAFVAYSLTMLFMLKSAHSAAPTLCLGLCVLGYAGAGLAQQPIYRCGNEFTNTVSDPLARGCQRVEGASVSVPAPRPLKAQPAALPRAGTTPQGGPIAGARVDAQEQRARDADARQILSAELKRAEARQLELQRDYNQGEPERRADESRNYQKYMDRVAEIKASLARNESDIASIRRELARQPGAALVGK